MSGRQTVAGCDSHEFGSMPWIPSRISVTSGEGVISRSSIST